MLKASATPDRPSRILSTGASQRLSSHLDFDDLLLNNNWSAFRAIRQAKLSLFCLTRSLAKKLMSLNITANIIDPGLVMTPYQDKAPFALRMLIHLSGHPVDYVANQFLYLSGASHLQGATGCAFEKFEIIPIKGEATDDKICEHLWTESSKLVGVDPLII